MEIMSGREIAMKATERCEASLRPDCRQWLRMTCVVGALPGALCSPTRRDTREHRVALKDPFRLHADAVFRREIEQ